MDAFDQSANALLGYIPQLSADVPYVGVVDITDYVAAAVMFIGLTLLFKLLQVIVLARLEAWSKKTTTDIDDVIVGAVKGIRAGVYTLIALYAALQFFSAPPMVDTVITAIALFAIVWQAIEVVLCFVQYGATRFLEKDEDGDGEVDPNAATASHMVTLIARLVLWALGGIFVLSNLGIEVTSLIAGLGIGGVAIAFALQGILGDLFASFSIYFDKPFRIGDFIVIGTDAGTVEKIGIKSTRIRTLQGEELVVSNAELTTARVQNFKKMEKRRIVSQFGVTYETPHDKVKAINGIVERIFGALDGADLDRIHFTTFADSALMFELVYFVRSSDYTEYLSIQQQFNWDLMDKFAEVGIEFAYPTQTLRFDSANALSVRTEK
jgi:small-conductance mechanosensitive channel